MEYTINSGTEQNIIIHLAVPTLKAIAQHFCSVKISYETHASPLKYEPLFTHFTSRDLFGN